MSYIIDESILPSKPDSNRLTAGINGGLNFSHRVVVTENGNPFIEFAYDKGGEVRVTRTEWEVKPLKPYHELTANMQKMLDNMVNSDTGESKEVKTVAEAADLWLKQKRRQQMQRLIEVAGIFTPKEDLMGVEHPDFLSFIQFISDSIGTKNEGVKLRAKFVYNYRGYLDTPDYVRAGDPWIESEDEVPKLEDSLIKINEGKDVLVRPKPNGSRPPKKENPLEEGDAPAKPEPQEDLPF